MALFEVQPKFYYEPSIDMSDKNNFNNNLYLVMLGQKSVNLDRPTIPYVNFTPKIISDKYS